MTNFAQGFALNPPTTNQKAISPKGTFNLDSLRLSQNFEALADVTKVVTTIRVQKPDRQSFFRVHPTYSFAAAVLELSGEREHYIVATDLVAQLNGDAVPKLLIPAITREGNLFVWPLRMPSSERPLDSWSQSALAAMQEAKSRWIRMASNMAARCYDVHAARVAIPEPEWLDLDLAGILEKTFDGRVIASLDHPVVQRLNGEI